MRKSALIMCAGAMALALSACAGGYREGVVVGAGAGPYDYDAYYDDYYGPFNDGYWGDDGYYFSDGIEGHPFRHDDGGHFHRTNPGTGFHGVHGHGAPAAGMRGGMRDGNHP